MEISRLHLQLQLLFINFGSICRGISP